MRGRIVPEISDGAVRELFVKNYRLIYEVRPEGTSFWRSFTARVAFHPD
jgi:hypothetical protein